MTHAAINPDGEQLKGVRAIKCQTESRLWFYSAVVFGLATSTGHPAGIALSLGMPFVCAKGATRAKSFETALGFYAAGLWPMIPGLQRYLGANYSPAAVVAVWFTCAALLASPWAITWTQEPPSYFWRIPATLLLISVPPLGLIGFVSPLVCAGIFFPGFGWVGLLITALLPGLVLSSPKNHTLGTIATVVTLSVAAHLVATDDGSLPGWQAVNTHFEDVSLPLRDYEIAQFVQERAAKSPTKVLIFPEFLIPRWSEATELFWSRTLLTSRTQGQILVIGAGVPRQIDTRTIGNMRFDFKSSISSLQKNSHEIENYARSNDNVTQEPFDNTLLVLGSQTTTFYQRVPVPLGMWKPFNKFSVPLRLNGSGVVVIEHERAAPLICYEQLIVWPVLTSMIQKPTVLVGISNTFWFNGTTIPKYQQSALRAWARLFALPLLSAVNS